VIYPLVLGFYIVVDEKLEVVNPVGRVVDVV
jgi:hypothetical protein